MNRGLPRGVQVAEGVVTRIDRAGKNLNGELIRFAFDPSQDWTGYVDRGAIGVPENNADRPKTTQDEKAANEQAHADKPEAPKVLEMVISKRSYIYTYARTPDGIDLYGAQTASSPDSTSSRTGLTRRPASAPTGQPLATNFTNIKEGSFVAVRYRRVGDLNEVLNLSLIEFPIGQPGETVGGAPAPGLPGGPAALPPGPGNVRIPSVPTAPVGTSTLPR